MSKRPCSTCEAKCLRKPSQNQSNRVCLCLKRRRSCHDKYHKIRDLAIVTLAALDALAQKSKKNAKNPKKVTKITKIPPTPPHLDFPSSISSFADLLNAPKITFASISVHSQLTNIQYPVSSINPPPSPLIKYPASSIQHGPSLIIRGWINEFQKINRQNPNSILLCKI